MGRHDLLNDPSMTTREGRKQNNDRVEQLVIEWTKTQTKFAAMDAIQTAGATAGAVMDVQDLSEDAHLRERGIFATVQRPVRGAVNVSGWPVRMSESRVPLKCAPAAGAHTAEVLKEWLEPRKQETKTSSGPSPKQALSGVKVVDFTQFEAGPSCTEVLGWLGADVVKIEEPQKGDRGRSHSDMPDADSPYFVLLNANKRSFGCDLKSQAGKEVIAKLIAKADIVVENMAPGAIERLGLGYDAVRQINPRVIFAQIKGFASDGPHANYRCLDGIAQAAGGSMAVTGLDDMKPLRPGAHMGDTGTGMHCVTGLLAALYQRHRTGRGQRVEVAMTEVVNNFNRRALASYLATGKVPGRAGNIGLYPCKGGGMDDYCYVATRHLDDDRWRRLLTVVAKRELLEDPKFSSEAKRLANVAAIDALVAAWCLGRTKTDAMELLQNAGVPASAVFGSQELYDDAQLHKRGMMVTLDHPKRGRTIIPGCPLQMSDSPVQVTCPPLLGAHTEAIVSEWLGG
jgi:formyl-CoA transferase